MRDFTIRELVRSFSMDYALIPEHVLDRICKSIMCRMLKIIREGKDNISIRKCDIHTIYKEVIVEEVNNEFMDLNETRQLTPREISLSRAQRYEKKGIYSKRVGGGSKHKRVDYRRLHSIGLRPSKGPSGGNEDVSEHEPLREQLQDSGSGVEQGDSTPLFLRAYQPVNGVRPPRDNERHLDVHRDAETNSLEVEEQEASGIQENQVLPWENVWGST